VEDHNLLRGFKEDVTTQRRRDPTPPTHDAHATQRAHTTVFEANPPGLPGITRQLVGLSLKIFD
jgi:hypothetical protein